MRTFRLVPALAIAAIALAGCSTSAATPTATTGATPAAASPTAAGNTLTVAYEENCQVELIAPSGQRVLIDVYDPTLLTSPAKSSDILLITHTHSDHYLATFADSFPGKKIVNETKEETIDGVKIKSIAASHDDQEVVTADPTNHIFVIEFNGFKIVHTGSTGQMKLTADQLTAIGDGVDLAAVDMVSVAGLDPNGDK
jgi:L-ascorbate metabolism protein UlaG (beta-lactamase superfamily)